MARSYDVAAAAFALDVPPKWLDNVLSHHQVPGVGGGRQGVTRAITAPALLHLAVVRALTEGAQLPVAAAVRLSRVLVEGQPGATAGDVSLAPAVTLRVDLPALQRRITARLLEAVEMAPSRRRGRPPARRPTRQAGAGE